MKTTKKKSGSGRVEVAKAPGSCCGCTKAIKAGDKVVGRHYRYHASCR